MDQEDVFVDPDTGQEYTADQVDWSRFDSVPEESFSNPEESFSSATANRITSGVSSLLGGLSGAGGFAIENDPTLAAVFRHFMRDPKEVAKPLLDFSNSAQNYSQELQSQTNMDTSDWSGYFQNFASKGIGAFSKMLPGMMLGPAGMAAQFGGETLGNEYAKARRGGDEPSEAGTLAAERGGVDYALAHLPLRGWGKPGGGALTEYIKDVPKTFYNLSLMSGLGGANRAVTEQLMAEDVPLSEFDAKRALQETNKGITDSTAENAALSLLLGGVKTAQRSPRPTYENIGDIVPDTPLARDPVKALPAPEPAPARVKIPPAEPVLVDKAELLEVPKKAPEIPTPERQSVTGAEESFPEPFKAPEVKQPEPVTPPTFAEKMRLSLEAGEPALTEPISEFASNTPEGQQAFATLRNAAESNPKKVLTEYLSLPDATENGVLHINTDIARELSPEYRASKISRADFSEAVHNPSSVISDTVFNEALKVPGDTNKILVLGGGGGSGKGTASKSIVTPENYDLVLDTTFANHAKSTANIDKALAAGKLVDVAFILTSPEIAAARALQRAVKRGRVVPKQVLAAAHRDALESVLKATERYADNDNVKFLFMENSSSKPVRLSLEEFRDLGYDVIRRTTYEDYNRQIERGLSHGKKEIERDPDRFEADEHTAAILERSGAGTYEGIRRDRRSNDGEPSPSGRGSGETPAIGEDSLTPEPPQPHPDYDESGFIRPELLGGKLFEAGAKRVREKWLEFTTAPERIEDIVNEVEKAGGTIRGQDIDPAELFLRGRLFGRNVPGASTMTRIVREQFTRPKKLAKMDPGADAVWQNRKEQYGWEAEKTFQLYEKAAPFFDLMDTTKVAQALASAREKSFALQGTGQKLVVTPEKLRQAGLSEQEIKAYESVRESLDAAWTFAEGELTEHWRNKLAAEPEKLAEKEHEIAKFFAEKRSMNYVPIKRYGDLFVHGKDPKTGETWYSLHEKLSDQRDTAKNIAARGFTDLQVGKVRKPVDAAYENMPNELAFDLNSLLKDPDWSPDMPVDGFKGHLLRAKLTAGYENDLSRNMASYITSLTQWASKLRFNPQQKELLEKIDPKSPVYQEMSDWLNYTNKAGKEGAKLRAALGHFYLGLMNPAAATLNSTQIFSVTYPELRRYTQYPMKALRTAMKTYKDYNKNPEAFATKQPELHAAITQGLERGMLTDEMARELFAVKSGREGKVGQKTWSDVSMMFNRVVERRNRVISFIAGYQNAPKGKDPAKFAGDFVEDTQFIYSRLNKPRIARGAKAPFYTFKTYGHNYWGNLNDAAWEMFDVMGKARGATDAQQKAEYKQQAKALRGTLARYGISTAALGGGAALPFVSLILAGAAANGIDLKKKLRDFVGNDSMADVMLYGPLSQILGVTLTGAVDPNQMISIDKGPAATAEKLAFGVVSDMWHKPARAMEAYNLTGDLGKAAQEVAPRTIRNLMQAYRWAKDGKATDIQGRTTMKDPTPYEILLKAMSFQPTRYTKAIEKSGAAAIVTENSKEGTEKMLQKLALAIESGDRERVQELIQQAKEVGYKINPSAIKERIKQNKDPDYRQFKAVPKRHRSDLLEAMKTYRK